MSGKYNEEDFLKRLVDSAIMIEETYESSKRGGEIYATLKKNGNLLNDADILIASVVKEHSAVLITNNEDHFNRIDGLIVENWMKT